MNHRDMSNGRIVGEESPELAQLIHTLESTYSAGIWVHPEHYAVAFPLR
jgi:hypothetical protein